MRKYVNRIGFAWVGTPPTSGSRPRVTSCSGNGVLVERSLGSDRVQTPIGGLRYYVKRGNYSTRIVCVGAGTSAALHEQQKPSPDVTVVKVCVKLLGSEEVPWESGRN